MSAAADRVAGAQRLQAAFTGHGRRAALMPYLMGGHPSLELSREIGAACVQAGADVLELGVPYSDPLADGPVIHAAGARALENGVTLGAVLDEVAAPLAQSVPVALMCYANVVLAHGARRFAGRLAEAGCSGLIVPDLPYEEADETLQACDEAQIALVPLVAPTTPDERLAAIGARARGFIYTVSVTGTTGERAGLPDDVAAVVARARERTQVPIALGFGISTPEHARQAADAGADGVIVGTRLVREAGEAADPAAAVGALVAQLAVALER